MNALDDEGVVSPVTALTLGEINGLINPFVRIDAFGQGWLVVNKPSRYGILQACPDGKYYLDQEAADNFRHSFARLLPF